MAWIEMRYVTVDGKKVDAYYACGRRDGKIMSKLIGYRKPTAKQIRRHTKGWK